MFWRGWIGLKVNQMSDSDFLQALCINSQSSRTQQIPEVMEHFSAWNSAQSFYDMLLAISQPSCPPFCLGFRLPSTITEKYGLWQSPVSVMRSLARVDLMKLHILWGRIVSQWLTLLLHGEKILSLSILALALTLFVWHALHVCMEFS